MKNYSFKLTIFLSLFLLFNLATFSQPQAKVADTLNSKTPKNPATLIKKRNIRSHMEFLASDALQGRGSGTIYELIAGQYLASQMQQFGIEPAGDVISEGERSYIQTIDRTQNLFAEPPKLNYSSNNSNITLEHGKELVVWRLGAASIKGELQKINASETPKKDSIVFVQGEVPRNVLGDLIGSQAAAIILEETPQWRAAWSRFTERPVSFTNSSNPTTALIIVSKDAGANLAKVSDGTNIEIGGKLGESVKKQTWNSVGMIRGSDAKLSKEVILLSAHMDHVGVRENAPGEDKIYNGADDDASGCVAVLELARILASGKLPKRTIYFAFFGSEEAGGHGSKHFVNNLPFEKENFVANLQFEMLGRPDAKVGKDELWLTGFERSDLGSELAKHGAKLVKDPHPEENFFRRSDNYTLARQGIVAHTVSSFGLHKDYHQPSDEIETIDFDYMTNAINSMIKPIDWLVNSDFRPTWHKGMRP